MIFKNEVENSENTPYKKKFSDTAINLAAKGTVGVGFSYISSKIPTGIDRSNLKYARHFTINSTPWYEVPGIKQTVGPNRATVQEVIWNSVKAAEEYLLKTPRAFSLSTFMGRSVIHNAQVTLKGSALEQQLTYLNKISGGKITKASLVNGLRYERNPKKIFGAGALYHLDAQGNKGAVALEKAFLYPGRFGDDLYSPEGKALGYASRFVRALYQKHRLNVPRSDFVVTGGTNVFKALLEQTDAYATVAMQNYVKLLDDPFELVSSHVEKILGRSTTLTRKFGSASALMEKWGLRNQFGVGGYSFMKGSAGELLKRHAVRGIPKIAAIVGAFKLVDTALRTTPVVKHTGFGLGVKGMGAKLFQGVNQNLARISDLTGATWLSKKQEKAAPGSTSITGLLSFAASGAIFGATAGRLMDIKQGIPAWDKGPAPRFFKDFADNMVSKGGHLGKIAKSMDLQNLGRAGSFAAIGAGIGLALVAPFMIGAIGASKSHEELRNIYSGREEVPMRRGRFWSFGSSAFSGGDIEFFAPHWTVRAMTDASRKGKLSEEYYNNPISYAIHRMIDPYANERALDKERPYTYWGPTDYGYGIVEQLLSPLKEAWKPTVVAHDEGFQGIHPSAIRRPAREVPTSMQNDLDGIQTAGYIPDPISPGSIQNNLSQLATSVKNTAGLQGFAISGLMDALTGEQSFLTPNSVHESSGRILSAQRAYWDSSYGDVAGGTEWIRRLTPDRNYETEHVSAPIRNQMPSWLGEGALAFGDPYAQKRLGELRLPGRGYESIFPELKGVDYEDYPLVHRMHILNSVAPLSPQFYQNRNLVEQQIANGELNGEGEDLYNEVLRQREMAMNEDRFDYGRGPVGSYYLGLKKLGRALPTEALYPVSPVHKFSGPVDPVSEYKSFQLLDKQFKLWQHPYSDFLKPAINRTIDGLSLVPFIPQEAREKAGINSYFDAMQSTKNQVLTERAQTYSDAGDFETAGFLRSGIRETLHGKNPYDDIGELTSMFEPNLQKYMKSMSNASGSDRSRILATVNPEMQQVLSANWNKSDYLAAGDYDRIKYAQQNAMPIAGMDETPSVGGNMPDRDFIGYAPGVDLNAFKVKTVKFMGKNIRDFNLWREDERQAQILDAVTGSGMQGLSKPFNAPNRENMRKGFNEYLSSIGMRDARITMSPTFGPTSVSINVKQNNSKQIHQTMRDEGWISN